MALIKTNTSIVRLNEKFTKVYSNCLAIEFTNNSNNDIDVETGKPIGYIMVINKNKMLLPGQSWGCSQLFGYIDNTIYNVEFIKQANTPNNSVYDGCVIKIEPTI